MLSKTHHFILLFSLICSNSISSLSQDQITDNSGRVIHGYIKQSYENALEIMLADSSFINVEKAQIKEYVKGDTLYNASGRVLKLPKINEKKERNADKYIASQKLDADNKIQENLKQALETNSNELSAVEGLPLTSNWEDEVPNHVFRLSVINPSIIFEKTTKSDMTLHFDIGMDSFVSSFYENNSNNDNWLYASPYFKFEWRHYSQLADRYYFGKSIKNFASNYYAPYLRFSIPLPNQPFWQEVGVHWGIQRNFRKRGFWNIGLGGGLRHLNNSVKLVASIDLGFGIVLSPEKE